MHFVVDVEQRDDDRRAIDDNGNRNGNGIGIGNGNGNDKGKDDNDEDDDINGISAQDTAKYGVMEKGV